MSDLKFIAVTYMCDGGVVSEKLIPAYQCEIVCERKWDKDDGLVVANIKYYVRHRWGRDKEDDYPISKDDYFALVANPQVLDLRIGKNGEVSNEQLTRTVTREKVPLDAWNK